MRLRMPARTLSRPMNPVWIAQKTAISTRPTVARAHVRRLRRGERPVERGLGSDVCALPIGVSGPADEHSSRTKDSGLGRLGVASGIAPCFLRRSTVSGTGRRYEDNPREPTGTLSKHTEHRDRFQGDRVVAARVMPQDGPGRRHRATTPVCIVARWQQPKLRKGVARYLWLCKPRKCLAGSLFRSGARRLTAWSSKNTVREEWNARVSWPSYRRSWAGPTNGNSPVVVPSGRTSAVNSCTHLSPKTCFRVLPGGPTVRLCKPHSCIPGNRWFPGHRRCRRSPGVRPRAPLGGSHPRCSRRWDEPRNTAARC